MSKPFLVGEGVYLRPLEIEDVTDEYLQWMNNVELAKFIPAMTFPGTRKAIESYVAKESCNPASVFLAIIEKNTGKHVGNIKLGSISWVDRNAEFGRMLGDESARYKGYGSEAAHLILRYAFDVLNLHKVFATCLASNSAAISSNKKNGMIVEGTIKEKRFVEGKYEDVIYMGINRRDYYSRRSEK